MKTFFKRLLAVPVFLFGLLMLIGGTIVNVFIKLPQSMAHAGFADGAGIIFGTILGTGTLIVISCAIIYGGYKLWSKDC